MLIPMFTFNLCKDPNCSRHALAYRVHCLRHIPDHKEYMKSLAATLYKRQIFTDCNFAGLSINHLDLRGKEFIQCSFTEGQIESVTFSKCRFFRCRFDICSFSQVRFLESYIEFCIFAGSRFTNCELRDSECIKTNFNGCITNDLLFDNSDLYDSRFIQAEMTAARISNCNIKRVIFTREHRNSIQIKYSNIEDAEFIEKGLI